jgi:hypothetical protein
MILNAYAVLDGFITLLRLVVALAVAGLAISGWRHSGRYDSANARTLLEDRFYLLFLLAFLLLALNLASWPLLYLLLQSYVREWPGAMCIYGVTQVGAGSAGPARFLPGLVTALQWTKPLLVWLTGAWFVLYGLNRRTQTGPLMQRVLLALVALGVLAAADSAAEAAYLVIPKKEDFLSTGCCTAVVLADSVSKRLPRAVLGENYRTELLAAHYFINVALLAALARCCMPSRLHTITRWLAPLLVGGVAALAVGKLFLSEVAAPLLLELPYHHCAYDLIPRAPESVVGIALFLFGSFSVAWACAAGWCGNCSETAPFLGSAIQALLFLALLGYLGALLMMSVEAALIM